MVTLTRPRPIDHDENFVDPDANATARHIVGNETEGGRGHHGGDQCIILRKNGRMGQKGWYKSSNLREFL